jgi:hypothetical protein
MQELVLHYPGSREEDPGLVAKVGTWLDTYGDGLTLEVKAVLKIRMTPHRR